MYFDNAPSIGFDPARSNCMRGSIQAPYSLPLVVSWAAISSYMALISSAKALAACGLLSLSLNS